MRQRADGKAGNNGWIPFCKEEGNDRDKSSRPVESIADMAAVQGLGKVCSDRPSSSLARVRKLHPVDDQPLRQDVRFILRHTFKLVEQ